MKEIVFTLNADALVIPKQYYPCPASKELPNWYKQMDSYRGETKTGHNRFASSTMKRCMPLLDSMCMGYYLKTFTEISIATNNDERTFNWASLDHPDLITYHPQGQVVGYKEIDLRLGAPKLYNPWGIKTPKGYSCLIIPPMHNPAVGIRILEGVVDTDTYTNAVQFPFIVDENFTGDIPAGTTIAQIIPFKRDDFKMKFGTDEDREKDKKISFHVRSSFLNVYKEHYRKKKNYT